MVVTFWPLARATGVTHERTASPLRCTVQQPHTAMPHPYFVPVRPRWSRRTHKIGVVGSTSTVVGAPFRTNEIFSMLSLQRLATRYGGQAPPASSQLLTAAANSACGSGGGVRPSPGFHAQSTRGSVAT